MLTSMPFQQAFVKDSKMTYVHLPENVKMDGKVITRLM
jgi:hypothetical protein